MNKLGILSLVILITVLEVRAPWVLVDKIDCVVCGPERNTPMVDTDVTHKGDLNGQKIPMQQKIQNEIICQQIVAEKIPMDPSAADKYIDSVKKQNNLTDSDLADMFEGVGMIFTEGLASLNEQYSHEMFMHHKFKSQVIATDDDIKEYYDEHPMYNEGWCNIQLAYVDCDESTKETAKKQLDMLVDGTLAPEDVTVEWSSPMQVSLKDIADDKRFIFEMKPGQIVIRENGNTFELYKLIDKQESTLRPLEECRSAIVDKLNRKQLEGMLSEYNQEVRKFIDIINLTDQ